MTAGVQEETFEQVGNLDTSASKYKVGNRVIWTALRNSPKHYVPGEKIRGEIIDAFDNGGTFTYRIRLDIVWNHHAISQTTGEAIVVGNVRASSICPCLE